MAIRHRDRWERYKVHGDRQARAELIREYVPLVHYVATRMSVRPPCIMDREDLVAIGILGLISAVHAFDPSRGIEFSTFAVPRVRGAIIDALRKDDWAPRTARQRAAELRAAMQESSGDHKPRSLGQVARRMKVSRRRLGQLMAAIRPISFVPLDHGAVEGHPEQPPISQLIADRHCRTPLEEAELSEQCERVRAILEELPEPQRGLIIEYYFKSRQQKDLAKEMRVSRSRVSQIHTGALATLRKRMEAAGAA